jgi:DNA-binding phage protein
MCDPEFASAYEEARAEIDSVDAFMRALDATRSSRRLTKAELARRSDLPPETVRRLFTAKQANPTISTVIGLLRPMGYTLEIVPARKARRASARRLRRAS